jgi:hypothetical protein
MTVNSHGYSRNSSTGVTFPYNNTASYKVLYGPKTGAGAYKVNITQLYRSPKVSGIMWIQTNGTITAVYISGHNFTGAAASGNAGSILFSFPTEYFYGAYLQSYLSSPGVQEINQTSLTVGPTTLTVTNYGISSPTSFCNGSGVIGQSSFQIQFGKVPGTTANLVTLWSVTGTFTPISGHGTLSYSSTNKVISVTKA